MTNQFTLGLCLMLSTTACLAQFGSRWVEYKPERKIHLVDFECSARKGLRVFGWTNHVEAGAPTSCALYDFDSKTEAETFKLLDKRSNRAEIRIENDYAIGSRQFEGYVTFYAPLNDESLFQIWGSDRGATQVMMRGYAANGGEIGINQEPIKGTPRVATHCYGREIKVNVIHLQEDVGNKFMVYLDNKKVLEFPDNEHPKNNDGKNYHKYGCYGTLKTAGAVVKWRAVRHFRDGKAPDEVPATTSKESSKPEGLSK
jgi:hypothetical protein